MNQHSAHLTIDLSALSENWRTLNKLYSGRDCGAVVKADAYGLGVGPVSKALWAAGCRTFFVANFDEGVQLRSLLYKEARIFVLQGCVAGMERAFVEHGLTPVLISMAMCRRWLAFLDQEASKLAFPVALKVNTGMNRLGITISDFQELANSGVLQLLNVKFLLSHLACADEPSNALNRIQLERFAQVVSQARKQIPDLSASLVNSAGMFLGQEWQFDLARPGVALYGGLVCPAGSFQNVVTLELPVLQLRWLKAGESIGYGAAFTASRDMSVAITAGGYADGIFRSVSNRAVGWCHGMLPVCGRVSMDSLVFDLSGLAKRDWPSEGDLIELIGAHCSLANFSEAAGTITYEVLTSLGDRLHRVYSGG